jgi:hypothetical protein
MGTWGAQILDDDLAMDIQAEFEQALEDGLSVKKATKQIIKAFQDVLEDEDEGPIVYLALAALQLERNELQPEIRKTALEIIETGQGLARWEEAGEDVLAERKKVLEEMKAE